MRSVKVVRQGPDDVLALIGNDDILFLTHDEARMLATLLGAVCDAPPAAEEPAAPWKPTDPTIEAGDSA